MAENFKNFHEYLVSRKEFINGTIASVIGLSDHELKLGNQTFNAFSEVLSMYFSPVASQRPDQLIKLGVNPRWTLNIAFDGSQNVFGGRVSQYLENWYDPEGIRNFAKNLSREFEGILEQ